MDKTRYIQELLPILDQINKNWQAVAIELINHTRKCSEKYHGTLQPLQQWFEKMEGRVASLAPVAVQSQVLLEQLAEQKVSCFM